MFNFENKLVFFGILVRRESSLQPIGLDYKTKLINMGCVSSKAEHDAVAGFATNANLFQVICISFHSSKSQGCPPNKPIGRF
jgi:hypothetical protein